MRIHNLTSMSVAQLLASERWQPMVTALHASRLSELPQDIETLSARKSPQRAQQLEPQLQGVTAELGKLSLPLPADVALVRIELPGSAVEVFVDTAAPVGVAVLLGNAPLSQTATEFVAGLVEWARWGGPEAFGPIARLVRNGRWDRWRAAQVVPLEEWIYTAGLGVHAALQSRPGLTVQAALGLNAGAFGRLRAREAQLWLRLSDELGEVGLGGVLRWLADDAPPALRRDADGEPVPAAAGRYLGWKMTAPRVDRVGLAAAAAMAT